MLKIVAPLNHVDEAQPLIGAGASELYCGVLDSKWLKKFGPVASLNRREWSHANLSSFRQLEEVVDICHENEATVSLTLNAPYYAENQIPDLKKYIESAVIAGVDAFFVSDIGAMGLIKETGSKAAIHVSSVASVFNHSAAELFKSLGAERIILPRHMRLGEIAAIVEKCEGLDFEAFVLYNKCMNVDGLCTYLHGCGQYGLEESACTQLFDMEPFPKDEMVSQNISNFHKWVQTPSGFSQNIAFQCGVCSLYRFEEMGLTAVKIIGRAKPLWMKLLGVELVSKFLAHVGDCACEKDFIRDVRKTVQNDIIGDHPRFCNCLNCYYPEHITWRMPSF